MKTEEPKTFDTIQKGVAYHKRKKLAGWFIVSHGVWWCYSDGTHNLTTMRPADLKTPHNGKPAQNIFA